MSRGWLVLVGLCACGGGDGDGDAYEPGEELAGGDTTVFDTTQNAYANAAANLHGERRDGFFVGNSIFNRNWVVAPSSTTGLDGLGPTFNATSCSTCHFKDGRGRPPPPGEPMRSMLVRLSVSGADAVTGGPVGEPSYGGQLQNAAIPGVPVEGRVTIDWEEVPGAYADGTPYSLRRPTYRFEALAFGPLADDTMFSPRVAPATFGLGLLEAIPAADLVAREDAADADGDGISGRANRPWDVAAGRRALGRFGWKANQPSLRQQTAGAMHGDLGVTSSLFPAESCPAPQLECAAAPSGGAPELDENKLDDLTFYGQTLAVPARRDAGDPTVLRGKRLFRAAGCAACHVPRWVTGTHPEVPELSGQTIWPYTDLLLHDMGPELADGRPDFDASGSEWRTPPLWGIGLLGAVNGHDDLLHDGRARGLAEAILWHGGEGEAAREAFRAMVAEDRAALLRFLRSL
jgi:CxxC motif-containing protein (DUF1111 family)